jgi:hypothetical protein
MIDVALDCDRERPLSGSSYLAEPASDSLPLQYTALYPLLTNDLGEGIAARYAMNKTKRVTDIALSRGVCSDQQ